MLSTGLRTYDIKDLLSASNDNLITMLENDYEMLREAREKINNEIKEVNSKSTDLYFEDERVIKCNDRVNYKIKLGISKNIVGTIPFTNDLEDNIELSLRLLEKRRLDFMWSNLINEREVIRLRMIEIEDVFKDLNHKFVKFDSSQDI